MNLPLNQPPMARQCVGGRWRAQQAPCNAKALVEESALRCWRPVVWLCRDVFVGRKILRTGRACVHGSTTGPPAGQGFTYWHSTLEVLVFLAFEKQ